MAATEPEVALSFKAMQAILAVRLVLEEMLLDSMVLHPMQARLWHCMDRHVVAFWSWPDGWTRLQRTHGLLLPLI